MLLYRLGGPAMLPLGMCLLNILRVVLSFLCEGQVKFTSVKFAWLYGMCIAPAWRGDLQPFLTVLSMPA